MSTLAELRTEARKHALQLEAVRYLTVQDLEARWEVGDDVIRAIAREKLPYLVFGKNGMRRYHPRDVERYEEQEKRGAEASAS